MKRASFIIGILFLYCFSVHAQISFQKTYQMGSCEGGTSVKQTTDGGYVVAGYLDGSACLLRVDLNGDTLWTKSLPTTGYGYSVEQTTDGGYAVLGFATGFGAGSYDIFLLKTDTNGNVIWTKTYGGTNVEDGREVHQTSDGGFIIVGSTNSFGAGGFDVYLIKTDSIGNVAWTKTYGGLGDDCGYSVKQTFDGGYILGGYTMSFGAGNSDVYLIKTDASGNLSWSSTFGGTNCDNGSHVVQTTDGKYLVTGITTTFGAGNTDIFLAKVDANGNALWTKTFGGASTEEGDVVLESSDRGIVIAGTVNSFGLENVCLLKTDSSGNISWLRTYGGTGTEYGYGLCKSTDGGYLICGYTSSFGPQAIYLIKTDDKGNIECDENSPSPTISSPTVQDSIPATIIASQVSTVTFPAIHAGSGAVVTTLCTATSINELNANSGIEIFPNPSNGIFTIENTSGEKIKNVEVYDAMGKLIYGNQNYNQQAKIDLSAQANGLYFVFVKTDKGIATQKIILQK
jgi:hypothetical protein